MKTPGVRGKALGDCFVIFEFEGKQGCTEGEKWK
jgi:hypothetical protein